VAGGWRLLRWRLAVLIPAAGTQAVEARLSSFDELVLLQRDLGSRDPDSQQVLAQQVNSSDDLDIQAISPAFRLLRQAVVHLPAGLDGSIFDIFKDFSLEGGGSLVNVGNRYMSSAEKTLYVIHRVFDTASVKDMGTVAEACDSILAALGQHRQRLRERLTEFSQLLVTVKHEDVIPLTANFVSKEILALKPLVRDSIKQTLRVLRHVDWGEGYHWLKLHLFMMEPAIVNGATALAKPLSELVRDYDDLTEIGFCRTVAPLVLTFAASARSLQVTTEQLSARKEEILALHTTKADPAWEEEPALLHVTRGLAEAASALAELTVEGAQFVNDTVGRALRQRLHCPEFSAAPRVRAGLFALVTATVSAWRISA